MGFSYEEKQAAIKLKDCLLDIARDLDTVHSVAQGFKLVGKVSAVAATLAGIGGTLLTGGLAAPVMVAVGVTGFAGTATSIGADIVEAVVSKSKMERAQGALYSFRKVCCGFRKACQGATRMAEATSALRNVITDGRFVGVLDGAESAFSGVSSRMGKMLPIVDKIFIALDVIDILTILTSDNASSAGDSLRGLVHNVLDKIINN